MLKLIDEEKKEKEDTDKANKIGTFKLLTSISPHFDYPSALALSWGEI